MRKIREGMLTDVVRTEKHRKKHRRITRPKDPRHAPLRKLSVSDPFPRTRNKPVIAVSQCDIRLSQVGVRIRDIDHTKDLRGSINFNARSDAGGC